MPCEHELYNPDNECYICKRGYGVTDKTCAPDVPCYNEPKQTTKEEK